MADRLYYANGNLALDGKRVFYKDGKSPLVDGSGNIYYRDGKHFKKGKKYFYPTGRLLQQYVNLNFAESGSLFSGSSISYSNGQLLAGSLNSPPYFYYPNGTKARDSGGPLFDPYGKRKSGGSVILFENIGDRTLRRYFGYWVAVLNEKSHIFEVNFNRLLATNDQHVQILPLKWPRGGTLPQTLKDCQIVVELGRDDAAILIDLNDNRTSTKPVSLYSKTWEIVAPSGILEVDFNSGVRAVHACSLLRTAMIKLVKHPDKAPRGGRRSFHLQGRFGRINVRQVFPLYSIQCAKELLAEATEKIRFESSGSGGGSTGCGHDW